MARKSRKQIAVEEPVIESVSSEVFATAIYARLSVENSGKSEKVDVIANQIEICKSYIAERPYLNLIDTYVDNGRTGTVFDRPEFNRLMNDIRTGRIKCLVVRDLSRFGRDYIEAGTYLERVFPQIGLRFIAIKENYDNFDADGSGESLIIPLQNMINTLYSKDISRKVSTALKAQMESGEFKKRNRGDLRAVHRQGKFIADLAVSRAAAGLKAHGFQRFPVLHPQCRLPQQVKQRIGIRFLSAADAHAQRQGGDPHLFHGERHFRQPERLIFRRDDTSVKVQRHPQRPRPGKQHRFLPHRLIFPGIFHKAQIPERDVALPLRVRLILAAADDHKILVIVKAVIVHRVCP